MLEPAAQRVSKLTADPDFVELTTPPVPINEGGPGLTSSDLYNAQATISKKEVEVEQVGGEALAHEIESLCWDEGSVGHRVVKGTELPRYDPEKVGRVSQKWKLIRRIPIESLLKPHELSAEVRLRRRWWSYLTPEDLRAWIRLWDLKISEAADILHVHRYTLWRHLERDCDFLPYELSRRLRAVRWKARSEVLAGAVDTTDDLRGNGIGFSMLVIPIPGEQYAREAYVHGLWPGDLAYYRKGTECAVVHMPTRLAAECNYHATFELNRSTAEGRLAGKLGQWAKEPNSRKLKGQEKRSRGQKKGFVGNPEGKQGKRSGKQKQISKKAPAKSKP